MTRAAGWLAAIAALGGAGLLWSYAVAVSEPRLRHAEAILPGLAGPELRVLLISDIHVAGPDMPPARLARIVGTINRLRPDAVLIAGDFVSDKAVATRRYSLADAIAPLAGLRPRLGTFAVLGNHDHWRSAPQAAAALADAGVRLLVNDAARAGPLAIGGLDDDYTGRADVPRTLARLRAVGGVPVLLSHSPDPFPDAWGEVPLMLAGHTHCGQIRLPLVGAVATMSEHGDLYACGVARRNGSTLVTAAGLGTSILPLRLGARPDMWMVRLRPGAAPAP
jgi:predicted MPP superfamily phosphohydrolase